MVMVVAMAMMVVATVLMVVVVVVFGSDYVNVDVMQCFGKGISAEWGKADDGGGDRGMRRRCGGCGRCVEDLRLVCGGSPRRGTNNTNGNRRR